MTRHLVVANQTLGGAELDAVLTERIERGGARFHVLVPMVRPEHEIIARVPADPMFAIPVHTEYSSEAVEQARQRSQHRLDAMLRRLTRLGGDADGELGDTDPYHAVQLLLERESFDEVIVSTLPSGISRWIRMDLPSRLERLCECDVTTVEAED